MKKLSVPEYEFCKETLYDFMCCTNYGSAVGIYDREEYTLSEKFTKEALDKAIKQTIEKIVTNEEFTIALRNITEALEKEMKESNANQTFE